MSDPNLEELSEADLLAEHDTDPPPVLELPSITPATGVIETLEHALELARAGKLLSVAVLGDMTSGEVFTGYDTHHPHADSFRILGALRLLEDMILEKYR